MSVAIQTVKRPTVDDFMTLFLCGLVLKGKRVIWIRTSHAVEERHRMYALHKYLNEVCDKAQNGDKGYFHFVLRLRNELSPGLIGAFDGFRNQVASKMATIVSVELPFGDTYNLTVQLTTARSILERAEPDMRKLAEGATDAYMAKPP